MTSHTTARPAWPTPSAGWVPFALVALVLVPAAAGSLRLIKLAGGPALMPENTRMMASPAPVVVHMLSATSYAVLSAFQFHPRQPGTGELAYIFRLALGAGTQVFTQGIGNAVFGVSELNTDLMLGAGWAVNLLAAEFIIRRAGRPTPRAMGGVRQP